MSFGFPTDEARRKAWAAAGFDPDGPLIQEQDYLDAYRNGTLEQWHADRKALQEQQDAALTRMAE